jgi:dTDP-4-dehydrorhamnose reductase
VRVLITGAGGQLGGAVIALAPGDVTVLGVSRAELDIADAPAVDSVLRAFRPDAIINAAGFTRVDDAEKERDAAQRANAIGPAVLAAACRSTSTWLVQVSTDYVFDGEQGRPYAPEAPTNPLSVYGITKLHGEQAVTRELPAHSSVVRTSWLYAAHGRNFLTTMLRLMRDRPELTVVSDQIGAPTSVTGLAGVLWAFARRRASGLYHWCDSGVASWYDFAVAIGEEAVSLGVLDSSPTILPITSAEYPTAARRPPYSLLAKHGTERLLGVSALHWRRALRETLRVLAPGGSKP